MNEKEDKEIQVASALTNLNESKANKIILPLGNNNDGGNDDDCFRVGMAHLNLEVSYRNFKFDDFDYSCINKKNMKRSFREMTS